MATKLHHPTITDHTIEVPDSQAAAWVEQGWRREDAATPTTNQTTDYDPYAGE